MIPKRHLEYFPHVHKLKAHNKQKINIQNHFEVVVHIHSSILLPNVELTEYNFLFLSPTAYINTLLMCMSLMFAIRLCVHLNYFDNFRDVEMPRGEKIGGKDSRFCFCQANVNFNLHEPKIPIVIMMKIMLEVRNKKGKNSKKTQN